jgi:hypothetical protein
MTTLRKIYIDINAIMKRGFKTEILTDAEVRLLAAKLSYLINSEAGSFCAAFNDDPNIVSIETTYCDPVLNIEITKTGIHFIPLTDKTWYGAFFEVMKFLYSLEEVKVLEEDKQGEEDSVPDFEWI